MVVAFRERITARGSRIGFLMLEDLSGQAEVMMFERSIEAHRATLALGERIHLYKRLERGRFTAPVPSPGQRSLAISAADLAMLLGGIDWRAARPTQLWKPDRSVADRGSTTAAA